MRSLYEGAINMSVCLSCLNANFGSFHFRSASSNTNGISAFSDEYPNMQSPWVLNENTLVPVHYKLFKGKSSLVLTKYCCRKYYLLAVVVNGTHGIGMNE